MLRFYWIILNRSQAVVYLIDRDFLNKDNVIISSGVSMHIKFYEFSVLCNMPGYPDFYLSSRMYRKSHAAAWILVLD